MAEGREMKVEREEGRKEGKKRSGREKREKGRQQKKFGCEIYNCLLDLFAYMFV
jgi:hypothetical protein